MELPGPIPNPEVKCGCADGTLNTQGRVSSCHDICVYVSMCWGPGTPKQSALGGCYGAGLNAVALSVRLNTQGEERDGTRPARPF